MLKKIIALIQIIATIVLVFAAGILVFTVFTPTRQFQLLNVMSGSMEPVLHVGSIVFLTKVDPTTLKQNDIITFNSTQDQVDSVTHRIKTITNKNGVLSFSTKGDANQTPDVDAVSADKVLGKVMFSIPYLGYLSVWMKTPRGFLLLVILPAIVIILNEIWNIKKAFEKSITEKVLKQVAEKATEAKNK